MIMHFSVDDFIDAFLALKQGKYQSIFEQETFAVLKRVHEACGAVFSCYCFYEAEGGSLAEVPGDYVQEFQANAGWLRFGFHGYDYNANYGSKKFSAGNWIDDAEVAAEHYNKVIGQLVRITGGGRCIDRFPRIHYYAGTIADCTAWKLAEYGICGLITAEDDRVCYYHEEEQWKTLIDKGFWRDETLQLGFWRTCIRLENMKDEAMLDEALSRLDTAPNAGEDAERDMQGAEPDIVRDNGNDSGNAYLVFTHEKFLQEKRIEEYFLRCGKAAKESGIDCGYFYTLS